MLQPHPTPQTPAPAPARGCIASESGRRPLPPFRRWLRPSLRAQARVRRRRPSSRRTEETTACRARPSLRALAQMRQARPPTGSAEPTMHRPSPTPCCPKGAAFSGASKASPSCSRVGGEVGVNSSRWGANDGRRHPASLYYRSNALRTCRARVSGPARARRARGQAHPCLGASRVGLVPGPRTWVQAVGRSQRSGRSGRGRGRRQRGAGRDMTRSTGHMAGATRRGRPLGRRGGRR